MPAHASHIDLFFAGGQSNAREEWAEGIEQGLVSSGLYENVEIAFNRHPGEGMITWWRSDTAETRRANYLADFYAPGAGEGVLEKRVREIAEAGDTYTFHGLFWFQGEGDNYADNAAGVWAERFLGMLDTIESDFATGDLPFVAAKIWGNQALIPADRWARIAMIRGQQQLAAETADVASATYDTIDVPRVDDWHISLEDLPGVGLRMAQTLVALPEPTSLILLGAGSLVLWRRR